MAYKSRNTSNRLIPYNGTTFSLINCCKTLANPHANSHSLAFTRPQSLRVLVSFIRRSRTLHDKILHIARRIGSTIETIYEPRIRPFSLSTSPNTRNGRVNPFHVEHPLSLVSLREDRRPFRLSFDKDNVLISINFVNCAQHRPEHLNLCNPLLRNLVAPLAVEFVAMWLCSISPHQSNQDRWNG